MQIKVYVKHREVLRAPKFDTLKFDINNRAYNGKMKKGKGNL